MRMRGIIRNRAGFEIVWDYMGACEIVWDYTRFYEIMQEKEAIR